MTNTASHAGLAATFLIGFLLGGLAVHVEPVASADAWAPPTRQAPDEVAPPDDGGERLHRGGESGGVGPPRRSGSGERGGGRSGGGRFPDGLARGGGRLGGGGRAPMSPELIERCLEVALEIDPELAERLRELSHESPEEFERTVRRQARRLIGLAELKSSDPELYDVKLQEFRIDEEVRHTAGSLRASIDESGIDSPVSAGLQQKLRGLLEVRVALSIRSRGAAIQRLETHLESMREKLEEEAANFETTVEVRLQAIMDRLMVEPDVPLDRSE